VCALLCLWPVIATAQTTTGTSPAGIFYEVSGAGDGEQDLPHIKEIAGLLVNGISGAQLVTIPRAGHMVNLDSTAAFNQALDAFLK
jgi:hypothetical protein